MIVKATWFATMASVFHRSTTAAVTALPVYRIRCVIKMVSASTVTLGATAMTTVRTVRFASRTCASMIRTRTAAMVMRNVKTTRFAATMSAFPMMAYAVTITTA